MQPGRESTCSAPRDESEFAAFGINSTIVSRYSFLMINGRFIGGLVSRTAGDRTAQRRERASRNVAVAGASRSHRPGTPLTAQRRRGIAPGARRGTSSQTPPASVPCQRPGLPLINRIAFRGGQPAPELLSSGVGKHDLDAVARGLCHCSTEVWLRLTMVRMSDSR